MNLKAVGWIVAALSMCCDVYAVNIATPAIADIYAADQADRQADIPDRNARKIDWPVVKIHDALRQQQTRALLREGGLRNAEDYYHAAVIFQHGDADSDVELAHALAVMSMTLDPAQEDPRYMVAATWDRYLTRKNKPQWYGTQFKRDESGKWVLLPIEPGAVDDGERRRLAVPPLAELQAQMDKLNGGR